MAVPTTTGQLCTTVQEMAVGDYIICKYQASSGAAGIFSDLGIATGTEIPVGSSATPNGVFYFIKANKGILISDRVIQSNISWDTLNSSMLIQGKSQYKDVTSDVVSVTASVDSPTQPPTNIFDKNINTSYILPPDANRQFPVYVWFTMSSEQIINRIRFLSYYSGGIEGVKDFEIFASSTGSFTGEEIKILSGSFPNDTTTTHVEFFAHTKYKAKFFQLKILSIYPGNGSNDLGIREIELYTDISEGANNAIMRSLSGGVAYVDIINNKSLSRSSTSNGAWPVNNEYDTYIKKSNLGGKVTPDDDNVWHHKNIWAWTQDTPVIGFLSNGNASPNTARMTRGNDNYSNADMRDLTFNGSSGGTSAILGFRPALEYKE